MNILQKSESLTKEKNYISQQLQPQKSLPQDGQIKKQTQSARLL